MVHFKRHLAKSVSYRIVGTVTTILLAIIFGAEMKWAGLFGVIEFLVKPIIYFLHERLWYKWIKFGINKEN